jgi:hypothetical protein
MDAIDMVEKHCKTATMAMGACKSGIDLLDAY